MSQNFAETLGQWAERQKTIKGLVLIGSQVRETGAINDADGESDWDFQLITSTPRQWTKGDWVEELGYGKPLAYCYRPTFGGVNKVTFILPGKIEVDLVLLVAGQMKGARLGVAWGLHRRMDGLRKAMSLLAVVIRPGYRFLKGEAQFGGLYERVIDEVADPRLSDEEVVQLAEGLSLIHI